MTDLSQSDMEELVVRHSAFRNVGKQGAKCQDCDWSSEGTQGAVTAAARRHVNANLEHEVVTIRVQEKITRAWQRRR